LSATDFLGVPLFSVPVSLVTVADVILEDRAKRGTADMPFFPIVVMKQDSVKIAVQHQN